MCVFTLDLKLLLRRLVLMRLRLNNCDDSRIIACSTAAVVPASSLQKTSQQIIISSCENLKMEFPLYMMFEDVRKVWASPPRIKDGIGQCWWYCTDRNETHLDDNPGNYNKYFAIIHTNVVTLEFISVCPKHPSLHSVSQWDQKQNFVSILLRI